MSRLIWHIYTFCIYLIPIMICHPTKYCKMLRLLLQQHYQVQCLHVVVRLSPELQVSGTEDLDPPVAHR